MGSTHIVCTMNFLTNDSKIIRLFFQSQHFLEGKRSSCVTQQSYIFTSLSDSHNKVTRNYTRIILVKYLVPRNATKELSNVMLAMLVTVRFNISNEDVQPDATLAPSVSFLSTTFHSGFSTSSTKKTCCIQRGNTTDSVEYGMTLSNLIRVKPQSSRFIVAPTPRRLALTHVQYKTISSNSPQSTPISSSTHPMYSKFNVRTFQELLLARHTCKKVAATSLSHVFMFDSTLRTCMWLPYAYIDLQDFVFLEGGISNAWTSMDTSTLWLMSSCTTT